MVKLLFPDICNVFLRFIYLAFKLIFTTLKTGTFMRRYQVLLCDVHHRGSLNLGTNGGHDKNTGKLSHVITSRFKSSLGERPC